MMSLLFPWCTVEQVEHARKQGEVEASPKPLAHRKSGGTVHTQLSQGDISGWLEDEVHVLT